jgi:hypothetical protein
MVSGTDPSEPNGRAPDRLKLVAVVDADMVGYSRLIDGAVRCVVKVQRGVTSHDGDQPPDRPCAFSEDYQIVVEGLREAGWKG